MDFPDLIDPQCWYIPRGKEMLAIMRLTPQGRTFLKDLVNTLSDWDYIATNLREDLDMGRIKIYQRTGLEDMGADQNLIGEILAMRGWRWLSIGQNPAQRNTNSYCEIILQVKDD